MTSAFTIDASRSKSLDDYLTHFYVLCFAEGDVAIGEAGGVRQISENEWRAQIGTWLVSSVSGHPEVYRGVLTNVRWQTVKGPEFKLVPKTEFTGKFSSAD